MRRTEAWSILCCYITQLPGTVRSTAWGGVCSRSRCPPLTTLPPVSVQAAPCCPGWGSKRLASVYFGWEKLLCANSPDTLLRSFGVRLHTHTRTFATITKTFMQLLSTGGFSSDIQAILSQFSSLVICGEARFHFARLSSAHRFVLTGGALAAGRGTRQCLYRSKRS